MLAAIGEPEMVDTRNDPRLSRIFANKVIKRYPAFAEFYGMEDAIEQVVSFFRHAAQGLEERKQILYLLGPVGGGKSSIAERLKYLMQKVPFYALKGSPVNESPLGCSTHRKTARCWKSSSAFRRATCSTCCRPGQSSGWTSTAATSASSAWSSATPAS
jgi:predicted Ser/Thr protein kinase